MAESKLAIVCLRWEYDSGAKNEAIKDWNYRIELAIMLLYVLFMHDMIIL